MTSTIIVLIEPNMLPVPDTISVVQEFGSETIRYEEQNKQRFSRGTVAVVSGAAEDLRLWLKQYRGVWTTNSPLLGTWQFKFVEEKT